MKWIMWMLAMVAGTSAVSSVGLAAPNPARHRGVEQCWAEREGPCQARERDARKRSDKCNTQGIANCKRDEDEKRARRDD